MCFGGGGAGSYFHAGETSFSNYNEGNAGCGGSGRFTEKDLILTPNQRYTVTIGAGGKNDCQIPSNSGKPDYENTYDWSWWTNGTKGGSTIFGNNLVVANGGSPAQNQHGGDGGAGGAGASMRYDKPYQIANFDYKAGNGGRGYEFGGGGGGSYVIYAKNSSGEIVYLSGGNGGAGGTWGGGGGGGAGSRLSESSTRREIDTGVRGAKGTYGGYGGGKSSSSSSSVIKSTDGTVSQPLSKWYLMLTQQYMQMTDTATAGQMAASMDQYPNARGYAGGGGGGFHSAGCNAVFVYPNTNSSVDHNDRITSVGGGGGGYGMPLGPEGFQGGPSGRGYGGGGFMGDFYNRIQSNDLYWNQWRSAIGASLGGAGVAHTKSSGGTLANYSNYEVNGKSGICVVFYRVKE